MGWLAEGTLLQGENSKPNELMINIGLVNKSLPDCFLLSLSKNGCILRIRYLSTGPSGVPRICSFSCYKNIFNWLKCKFQSKRLMNPQQNEWEVSNTGAIISFNGLCVSVNTGFEQHVFARQGFPISGELCRPDNFPGTVVYYFEVATIAKTSDYSWVNNFPIDFGRKHKIQSINVL